MRSLTNNAWGNSQAGKINLKIDNRAKLKFNLESLFQQSRLKRA